MSSDTNKFETKSLIYAKSMNRSHSQFLMFERESKINDRNKFTTQNDENQFYNPFYQSHELKYLIKQSNKSKSNNFISNNLDSKILLTQK